MGLFRRKAPRVRPMPKFQPQLSYEVANVQGIGSRADQQDSFAFANAMDVTEIKKEGLLAMVADGMGGLSNGKDASSLVVQCVMQSFKSLDRQLPLGPQLQQVALRANDLVHQTLGGNCGSTLVAGLFFQEQLHWVSVGDSYCYLVRNRSIYQVNHMHTYRTQLYKEAIDDGILDVEDAKVHPDGHRLSSYLGASSVAAVNHSTKPLALQSGDILFFCSDGITEAMDEQTLLSYLLEPISQANALIEAHVMQQRRRHQDNFTALIVKCVY